MLSTCMAQCLSRRKASLAHGTKGRADVQCRYVTSAFLEHPAPRFRVNESSASHGNTRIV